MTSPAADRFHAAEPQPFGSLLRSSLQFGWWEIAALLLLTATANALAGIRHAHEETTQEEARRTARQPQRP